MRMWKIDPKILCRRHLLGAHLELHMFLDSFKKKRKVDGFLKNNLLEPLSLKENHDEIVNEFLNRGYQHKTPLDFDISQLSYLTSEQINVKIDPERSSNDLFSRCQECQNRMLKFKNI